MIDKERSHQLDDPCMFLSGNRRSEIIPVNNTQVCAKRSQLKDASLAPYNTLKWLVAANIRESQQQPKSDCLDTESI
jgi:hypothetical protein